MFRKPSSQLHLPLLALLVLALIISIATLACAASTLRLFESQQGTNPWLLPIWRNHFDLRGLKLVVGTSAAVAVLDAVCVVVLVVLAVQVSACLFTECRIMQRCISVLTTDHGFPRWQLFAVSSGTALLISAMTSLVSACLALPAATLPLVLNARAPGRDTLQSWTCGWVSQGLNTHDGMPGDFGRVCGESVSLARLVRFVSYLFFVAIVRARHRHLSKTGLIAKPAWEDIAPVLSTPAAHQAAEQREPLLTNVFSQRFATYAPLATLFLHLALLAVSLTALQKAKSNSSTRAVTPNSEDGEKMELEEYKNFPKEDKA